jgi:hypothetical protein
MLNQRSSNNWSNGSGVLLDGPLTYKPHKVIGPGQVTVKAKGSRWANTSPEHWGLVLKYKYMSLVRESMISPRHRSLVPEPELSGELPVLHPVQI